MAEEEDEMMMKVTVSVTDTSQLDGVRAAIESCMYGGRNYLPVRFANVVVDGTFYSVRKTRDGWAVAQLKRDPQHTEQHVHEDQEGDQVD